MSEGAFESGRYADNLGGIHAIRVQPETKGLVLGGSTNSYPAGAVDTRPRAKVSGSTRKFGVNARKVSIRFTAAAGDYKEGSVISLPWFVPATFDALTEGAVGTYQTFAVELVGTRPEKIK